MRSSVWPVIKVIALLLPLGLDTFVVSAALGAGGLAAERRLRVALVFTLFEAAMPLVGLGLGASLSAVVGSAAEFVAAGVLLAFGLYVLLAEDEDAEVLRLARMAGPLGMGTLLLGLSISLDELAIGFAIGALNVNVVLALVWIAVQAFVVAQIGLRLGTRVSESLREGAEKLVGAALIALAVVLIVERVTQ